ncbi:MAG: hypothetical protein ABSF95_04795 [Verrucomicrobiota bacterium]|jgi:hypothetical protein
MLAPREVNENACQAEQNLPVSVAGSELPQGAGRERKAGEAAWEPAAAMPSGGGEAALAVPGHSAGHELTAQAEPLRPHAGAADAVRHAIDSARVGLERAEAASVRLVLRPDANTQLALHIKWQQGHFEALAVVERGDFAALGAGWTQLQSRLAEQGVRLAPLVSSLEYSRSFLGGQSSSARQERSSEQDLPGVEELKELPSSRRGTSQPGRRNRSSGSQREWWA